MLINIIITALILLGGILFSILHYKKNNSKVGIVFSIIASILLSVTSNFITDGVKQIISISNTIVSNADVDTNEPETATPPKTPPLGNDIAGDIPELDTEDDNSERKDGIGANDSDIGRNQGQNTNHNTGSLKPDNDSAGLTGSDSESKGENGINTDKIINSQVQEVLPGTNTITDNGNNDTSKYAQDFILGDTIDGSISLEGDVDFFKFTLSVSGQVNFDILSYMKYYTLVIYDMTGAEIWYTDNNESNQTVGFREDSYNIDLDSGNYFLKVTGYKYGASYASTGNYTIKTSFLSANANETEPNNTANEATQISLGDTIQGLIGENDRFDFFKFTLSQAGRICLDITSYMRYYTLILYDTTGAEIWYSDNNEYNSTMKFREDVYYLDLESGDFFLRVTGYKYGTSYASTGNYIIATTFTSANTNEIESNNSSGEATQVSMGNTMRGLIGINDRLDFYEFTLLKSEEVTLDITSYMRYYCLILYDSTGSQLWYTDNNEFNETSGFRTDKYEIDLEKGTYYLSVTGYKYGTSYASTGNYTITINSV